MGATTMENSWRFLKKKTRAALFGFLRTLDGDNPVDLLIWGADVLSQGRGGHSRLRGLRTGCVVVKLNYQGEEESN